MRETPAYLEPVFCDQGHELGDCECCERVSMCCAAPEHPDVENFCGACNEGTGFECTVHECAWEDCPMQVGTRAKQAAAFMLAQTEKMFPRLVK